MKSLKPYQTYINNELIKRIDSPKYQTPKGLYEPCAYILKNGGKRVRASLVLMATKLFSHNYLQAISTALAFETFHNFTLIHDDIMDDASLRRGQQTVHVKWNTNTAILSGDAVMILAYTFFEETQEHMPKLFNLLNVTALEVCEGQQYDIDLEQADLTDSIVSERMYIRMIELKTSVLIAACLKAGAIIGGASDKDADLLYEFGRNLGIAFQLQDDLLDTYGEVQTLGKKIGGDIYENKKTFLVIKALEQLPSKEAENLIALYKSKDSSQSKYKDVVKLFDMADVKEITETCVAEYFSRAEMCLSKVSVSHDDKVEMYNFLDDLKQRNF